MTITSNDHEYPVVNPYLSVIRSTKGEAVFSLYGKIKRLRWEQQPGTPDLFENYDAHRAQRSLEKDPGLAQWEKRLLQADVLTYDSRCPEKEVLTAALVCGTGYLADLVCETLEKRYPGIAVQQVIGMPEHEAETDTAEAVTILCPESATRGQLSEENRKSMERGRPFGFLYFNGQSLVAGPVVIPGKTPCLDCLMTWLRDKLAKQPLMRLVGDETTRIKTAVPYQPAVPEAALRAVNLVLDQLAVAAGKRVNALMGRQAHVPLAAEVEAQTTKFARNAGCPVCHAGFETLFRQNPEDFPPPPSAVIAMKDVPTCHTDNGYRALDSQAARELVETAITRMGAEIQVTKLNSGPLDQVIPSFRAVLRIPGKGNDILGFGKGTNNEQAYLSAAFEAVERLCSEPGGNMPLLRAPWSAVKERAIDVPKRIGTVYFYRNNEPFTESTPIDWVWGQCLYTGTPLLVPASMVGVGPTGIAGKFYTASTGGRAAGTSMEDAVLQGLMEAIEHDAWMIWQANGVICPEIQKESIEDSTTLDIIRGMESHGFQVRIRYLAPDVGIPVFRVWLVQPDSIEVFASHGLGCHLNKYLALKRAVTEAKLAMPQTLYTKEPNTRHMSRGNREILNSKHSLFYLYHFTQTDLAARGESLSMSQVPDMTTGTVAGDTTKALRLLAERIPGLQAVGVNLTNPDLGIPVVRVIASGLQPLSHPLQAVQERLFTVPCAMGMRDTRLTYRELFNGMYPF